MKLHQCRASLKGKILLSREQNLSFKSPPAPYQKGGKYYQVGMTFGSYSPYSIVHRFRVQTLIRLGIKADHKIIRKPYEAFSLCKVLFSNIAGSKGRNKTTTPALSSLFHYIFIIIDICFIHNNNYCVKIN